MKTIILIAITLLSLSFSVEKKTFRFYITNIEGEVLKSTTIAELSNGVYTSELKNGKYYELKVVGDTLAFNITHIGYRPIKFKVAVDKSFEIMYHEFTMDKWNYKKKPGQID